MQVLSCGLLCGYLASSPLLSRVSIKGPHQMEQQREILLKSGKRTCIRSKYQKQNQMLQISVQIWGGDFQERFEEFNLTSVILWFITRVHYQVNTAKDFVKTLLTVFPLVSRQGRERTQVRNMAPGGQVHTKPLSQTGLQRTTRKIERSCSSNQGPLASCVWPGCYFPSNLF